MKILRARTKDSHILADIFSTLYKSELRWSEKKIHDKMQKREEWEYYLLLVHEKPEGALSLEFGSLKCELEAIAVKHRRQGHERTLLQFAEERTRQRGFPEIYRYSLDIYDAKKFYLEAGWIKENSIKDFFDGQSCTKYSKSLI